MFRVVRFGMDDAFMADARAIRDVVFCQEQHVSPEEEWDGLDPICEHFLILDGDEALGTARLRNYAGMGKIERVAVLQEHRGRKAGWDLMQAVIDRAREREFPAAKLNAQVAVEAFYAALGFVAEGERFVEADIEHIRMTLSLSPPPYGAWPRERTRPKAG
ncbi:MAG: GNAT family N-acetyltransferase [Rhodospirillaceae bacterium]